MKSKFNARSSRKIKCNSFSMNFKKKIMLKRVSILFFILIFFSSIFISNLNTSINEPNKKDLISYDEDPKLSNQGDDIFKLVFGARYGPDPLDPQNAWDYGSYNVIDQVCEGLFSHNLSDPNLSIIPRLATAKGTWMINSTDTWYTISLRPNVFFHDGTKFNASAVKFTFDRLSYFMNVSGTLPGGVGRSIISGLYEYYDFDLGKNFPIINNTVIIDEYTIRFELNKPYGPFESLLCFSGSYILSPTSTPQYDYINTTIGDLVGTGPFVYDRYIPGDEVKFHAFENYWAGKANITILKFSIIPSATDRNNALLSGEVDLIIDPLGSMYDTFDADPDITLTDAEQTALVQYLGMNNKRINATWRKAISNAINYSYIINELLEGNAIRLKSPLPENMIFANWSFNVALYNVTKAREIMQSMGFGVGFTTEAEWSTATFASFNYTYNIGNSFREDILTLLQVNLDKIGIEVTDAGMAWWEYLYRIYEIFPYTRDMLELYFLNWMPDYFDPSKYINDLFTNRSVEANGVQYNGYTEAIEAGRDPFDLWDNVQLLMDAALFETDQIARKAMYDRIQQLLVEEDMPWAFSCLQDNYDAYQSHILGFQSNSMGILSFYGVTQNSTIAPQIIYIDGIQEWQYFKDAGKCTGQGTSSDPYVIEDLVIDGRNKSVSCIHIENSDVYFTIENCTVFNSTRAGIELVNVTNLLSTRNNCSNNYFGMYLEMSGNNSISNNSISGNYYGIWTIRNNDNNITENTLNSNKFGIVSVFSVNNSITGNTINSSWSPLGFGIGILLNSSNNIISNNIVNNHDDYGIFLLNNVDNVISGNSINNNTNYGIFLDIANNSLIFNNTLIGNGINALDNGTSNDWDNGSIGNYWDDYGGVDANDDGIGDTPYMIPGSAGSQDNFPIWDDGIESIPTIVINAPISNSLFGITSPNFNVEIAATNGIDTMWYTLDGGLTNITFIANGTIDQMVWNTHGNGTVTITFYANDTLGKLASNFVTVRKDIIAPDIIIISPISNELFGTLAPSFIVDITDISGIDPMWYALNGGINITFTTNGTIDQTEWDAHGNGTVTIFFYANDTVGNLAFNSVIVRKDIELPNINIISPLPNELFGTLAPAFIVGITDISGIDAMWYTLNGGLTNTTFTVNGTIDQTEWDAHGNGTVTITFYANDTVGNLASNFVIVRKDIEGPTVIINSPLPNELFGSLAPSFTVEIAATNGIDTMWYTLDGGLTNITFIANGTIDQTEWDAQGNGTVTITFYANDTLGKLASNFVIVRKDILSGPTILINTPTNNSIFGYNPPNFNVEITNINVIDTMWYTLDGGLTNITFIANGTIDQTEWEAQGNGTIIIRFYSNNTLGILSFVDIIVGKDIEIPVIIIHHPIVNATFLLSSPEFNLSITEGNLDLTWYSLSNGTYVTGNFTFSGLTGKIDQELWDSFISGPVEVIFYAIDLAGNIGFQNVSIIKQSEYYILETIIIDDTGAGNYTWDQAKAQEWCSGSGTWNDPYIIEFLEIDGLNNGSSLIIRNSNAYFIIRDSIFYNSGGGVTDAGLKLEHVSNATLINLDCSNNDGHGIYLYDCYNITILESNMNHNKLAGIFLNASSFNFILNNTETINYNHWGIYLLASHNNTVSGNLVGYNQVGLFLKQSNNNAIIENIFMENDEAYIEEDSYGNTFQGNTVVQKPDNLFVIIITVIGLVSISGVSFIVVRKRIIIPKKGRKIKVYDKKKIKVEEKIHNRLLAVDRLIELKNVKEALKDLEEIKDLCKVYGLFEKSNECDEKITQCNSEYLEMINIVKRVVLNLATKFARLEIIDISDKTGISDKNFIIEVLQEMFRNNEINGEYFSKSKAIAFDRQSNIEQIEQFIKIYREWEMLNLDRDDSELLLEEIRTEEIKPKAIVSKLLPEKFKELNVFLSYFTLDADHFQILRVVKSLEEYPEIDKVMYWESDRAKEIADYAEFMDETLKKYDVFVLFCSTNSMKSASVKDEWQAAFEKRKKGLITIIPVYEKPDDIPVILGHLLNVKYDKKQFENFIRNLYQEIMRSRGSRIS